MPLSEAKSREEVEQSGVAQKILAHWLEHLPKTCRKLEQEHHLYQTIWNRAELTARLIQQAPPGDLEAMKQAWLEHGLVAGEKDPPNP